MWLFIHYFLAWEWSCLKMLLPLLCWRVHKTVFFSQLPLFLHSLIFFSLFLRRTLPARLFLPLRVQKRRAVLFLLFLSSRTVISKTPRQIWRWPVFHTSFLPPSNISTFLEANSAAIPRTQLVKIYTLLACCEQKRGRKNEECTRRCSFRFSPARALIKRACWERERFWCMYIFIWEITLCEHIIYFSYISPQRVPEMIKKL